MIVILTLLLSCSNKEDNVRFGIIQPSMNHLPLDILLVDQSIDGLDIINFKSGWETGEALIAEEVDIAILPFTYIWSAVAAGHDIVSYSFLERESDGIVAQPQYENIKDLQNKRVGVLKASTLDIIAEMVAEELGIQWELIYFRTPMDLVAALKSKEVDAISYYIPPILKLKDDYNILHWYGESFPNHPCCNIAVSRRALAEHNDLIDQLMRLLNKQCMEIEDADNKILNLIHTHYGLDMEFAADALNHIHFSTEKEPEYYSFEKKAFNKMIEKGYITNIKDADEIYKKVFTP